MNSDRCDTKMKKMASSEFDIMLNIVTIYLMDSSVCYCVSIYSLGCSLYIGVFFYHNGI
jgi:hypothetical protein